MPLELGLFLGAREFGDRRQRKKVTLVLEREKYSYLKFCSDISGQDPEAHNGDPSDSFRVARRESARERRSFITPPKWLRLVGSSSRRACSSRFAAFTTG
jgi:hypothetical protein